MAPGAEIRKRFDKIVGGGYTQRPGNGYDEQCPDIAGSPHEPVGQQWIGGKSKGGVFLLETGVNMIVDGIESLSWAVYAFDQGVIFVVKNPVPFRQRFVLDAVWEDVFAEHGEVDTVFPGALLPMIENRTDMADDKIGIDLFAVGDDPGCRYLRRDHMPEGIHRHRILIGIGAVVGRNGLAVAVDRFAFKGDVMRQVAEQVAGRFPFAGEC